MATLEVSAPVPAPSAVEVFCSYSRKDTALREELDTHLRPLQAKGLINFWHDHAIPPGEDWENQIDERLGSAQIILLLVSPDFMASEPCQKEMGRALQLRKLGQARVIPILLRHVDWHGSPLGKLQALPKDGRPVNTWEDRDQAFKDVTIGVRRVAEKLRDGQAKRHVHPLPGDPPEPHPPSGKSGIGKYALMAAAAVLVLVGLTYLAQRRFELKRLREKPWPAAVYNDPDLSRCMGVQHCLERATQAAVLGGLSDSDWANTKVDSPLLSDCMALPACVARSAWAVRLKRVMDWNKLSPGDRPLLADCMGYPSCVMAAGKRATPVNPSQARGQQKRTSDDEGRPLDAQPAINK